MRLSRNAWLLSAFVAGLALVAAGRSCADELRLKDGSKVTGSIVGFDDSAFKVQTSYGFALVKRDQVVSISMSDAPKPTDKKPDAATAAASKKDAAPPAASSDPKAATAPAGAAGSPVAASAPTTSPTVAGAAPALSAPAPPPPPEPIRENVNGTVYTNETYAFQMYKPPSWHVIAGAQTMMPGAVAAMGNLDETTYLLIGRGPAGKTMTNDIEATDRRLHGMLENFRELGESQINVSGVPAIQQKFRASVDQKDWSGTVVFVAHAGQLYTIFGMTLADSDLVQIQENVIARSISSLQFAQ
jgi:hypothetical protein